MNQKVHTSVKYDIWNNFKKHLLEKFLNINASRKHFSIKDILRCLFHFLTRLYCTN